jgi:hypothetical protein
VQELTVFVSSARSPAQRPCLLCPKTVRLAPHIRQRHRQGGACAEGRGRSSRGGRAPRTPRRREDECSIAGLPLRRSTNGSSSTPIIGHRRSRYPASIFCMVPSRVHTRNSASLPSTPTRIEGHADHDSLSLLLLASLFFAYVALLYLLLQWKYVTPAIMLSVSCVSIMQEAKA